jgi:hypothetical protein
MDLHPPDQPIRTIKDFALHLCVVTVGILIALGLEQVVEVHHRAQVAREAVEGFRHELADNREQVKAVLDALPQVRGEIVAQLDLLNTNPLPAGARFKNPGVSYNPLYAASWDTAIATQALSDLPYESVKKFSEAYSVLRVFADEERIMLNAWHDLRAFGEDLSILTPDQRRSLIEQLHRYDSFIFSLDSAGKEVLRASDVALH